MIGNNHRYRFIDQLSIFDRRPSATACGKFDFWREQFDRTVMRGEKGIPILCDYGNFKRVEYVFDVSQTVSRNNELNEVNLWQFGGADDLSALRELIEGNGFEYSKDSIHLAVDENGLTYNRYFVEHLQMILGKMEEVSGRFGNTLTCLVGESTDWKELLEKASDEISLNAEYEEMELLEDEITTISATDDVKNFSYCVIDDEVISGRIPSLSRKSCLRKTKKRSGTILRSEMPSKK